MDSARAKDLREHLDRERAAVHARIRFATLFPRGITGRSGDAPRDPIVLFRLIYDRDDDSLFGSLADETEDFVEEASPGLFLRCRIESYKPIGFEVLDFASSRTAGREALLKAFPEAARMETSVTVELRMPLGEVERRLQQIVPADWPTLDAEALSFKPRG